MSTALRALRSILEFFVHATPAPRALAGLPTEGPPMRSASRVKRSHSRAGLSDELVKGTNALDLSQKKHVLKKVHAKVRAIKLQAAADGKRFREMIVNDTWHDETRRGYKKRRVPAPSSLVLNAPTHSDPGPSSRGPIGMDPDSPNSAGLYGQFSRVSPTAAPDGDPSTGSGTYVLDLTRAYKWFRVVRSAVIDHGSAELVLAQGCAPHELAFMLSLGWIALEECLMWADARSTLGEGLIILSTLRSRNIVLRMAEGARRPRTKDVDAYKMEWEKVLRKEESCAYDWNLDARERKKHGPFGHSLATLAPAAVLESILAQPADSDISSPICLPDSLQDVLNPILRHINPRTKVRGSAAFGDPFVGGRGNTGRASVYAESPKSESSYNESYSSEDDSLTRESDGPSCNIWSDSLRPGTPESTSASSLTLFSEFSRTISACSTVGDAPLIDGHHASESPFTKTSHVRDSYHQEYHETSVPSRKRMMDDAEVDKFSHSPQPNCIGFDFEVPFIYSVEQDAEMPLAPEIDVESESVLMNVETSGIPLGCATSAFIGRNENDCDTDEEMQTATSHPPDTVHAPLQAAHGPSDTSFIAIQPPTVFAPFPSIVLTPASPHTNVLPAFPSSGFSLSGAFFSSPARTTNAAQQVANSTKAQDGGGMPEPPLANYEDVKDVNSRGGIRTSEPLSAGVSADKAAVNVETDTDTDSDSEDEDDDDFGDEPPAAFIVDLSEKATTHPDAQALFSWLGLKQQCM